MGARGEQVSAPGRGHAAVTGLASLLLTSGFPRAQRPAGLSRIRGETHMCNHLLRHLLCFVLPPQGVDGTDGRGGSRGRSGRLGPVGVPGFKGPPGPPVSVCHSLEYFRMQRTMEYLLNFDVERVMQAYTLTIVSCQVLVSPSL